MPSSVTWMPPSNPTLDKDDPLYKARRLLQTGIDLLTQRQNIRLDALFAVEDHAEVEVTWSVYQNIISAYRDKDRAAGRAALSKLIDSIKTAAPTGLAELAQLGRTLHGSVKFSVYLMVV